MKKIFYLLLLILLTISLTACSLNQITQKEEETTITNKDDTNKKDKENNKKDKNKEEEEKPKEYLLSLDVNSHSAYTNSIMPDSYIDLYAKWEEENNQLYYGRLISSILVTKVLDAQGNDVFDSNSEYRTPAFIVLSFENQEDYFLIKRALLSNRVIIEPVPRNDSYGEKPPVADTSGIKKTIQKYLDSLNINVP